MSTDGFRSVEKGTLIVKAEEWHMKLPGGEVKFQIDSSTLEEWTSEKEREFRDHV